MIKPIICVDEENNLVKMDWRAGSDWEVRLLLAKDEESYIWYNFGSEYGIEKDVRKLVDYLYCLEVENPYAKY